MTREALFAEALAPPQSGEDPSLRAARNGESLLRWGILTLYPYVEPDDIRAVLQYAAWRTQEADLPPT